MRDATGRIIDYLRMAVTDRCNFRCSYCMPPDGGTVIPKQEILTYEEMLKVLTILSQHGVNKIRLTGGEPLMRKGIVDFIHSARKISTISELAITTNGSFLFNMADRLKAAGLDRVNISIDTLDSRRFSRITGGGNLNDVLKGIESAIWAGLTPVKVNVVLTDYLSEQDVNQFINLADKNTIAVRFIEYMPVGRCSVNPGAGIAVIKTMINQAGLGKLSPAKPLKGNGPAQYYQLPGALGVFGFITPITDNYCNSCNRIRLTADGKIKPCLLDNVEFDIREALRGGVSDQAIYRLFIDALSMKPVRHRLSFPLVRNMFQIGG